MAQMEFLDLLNRYATLDAKRDQLVWIDALVQWDEFRPLFTAIWRKPPAARQSLVGRKPWNVVTLFKTLVVSALYNLAADQIDFQIRDRLWFMRFLGLGREDRVPDAKTVWLYREGTVMASQVEVFFSLFDGDVVPQGYMARGAGRFWTSSGHA